MLKNIKNNLLTLILKQLPYWCARVLLEKVAQVSKCVLFHKVLLCVEGDGRPTENW